MTDNGVSPDPIPLGAAGGGGALYALSHPYAVDGRVSWHEPSARGWAPMNCYLLREEGDALLVDTGLTIHRDAILAQLERLLAPGDRLSILCLRLGEFDAMCNILPIGERYSIDRFYGLLGSGHLWGDFLPEPLAALRVRRPQAFEGMRNFPLGRGGTAHVGARELPVLFAPLHLLASYWIYDEPTRTLLVDDVFTHVLAAGEQGPWVVGADDDTTTEDDVRAQLLGTRYWWLDGARTDAIRAGIADVFERCEVETLAPAYGCILQGRDVVERHVAMLDRVLADLGARSPRRRGAAHAV